MRTLYLDCGMGAAGDMLTASLLQLFSEPVKQVKKLNDLKIPGKKRILIRRRKSRSDINQKKQRSIHRNTDIIQCLRLFV